MELSEIRHVFQEHWKKGSSSVSAEEAEFIQSLIVKHRPERFIEIGTASGLSGGLICRFLEENGGKEFITVDHDNTFFGDPSLPNGFALDKIYTGNAVKVDKRPHRTALNVPEWNETYDMAFVDANHQHPWPLIDTLCLYPFMTGSKLIVHHDLRLYRTQDIAYGIGPKYLFDQFLPKQRFVSPATHRNTFYVDVNMRKERMADIAEAAFLLPWSLRAPMPDDVADQVRQILKTHYTPAVRKAFDTGFERFNSLSPDRAKSEPKSMSEKVVTKAAEKVTPKGGVAQAGDLAKPKQKKKRRSLNPKTWIG